MQKSAAPPPEKKGVNKTFNIRFWRRKTDKKSTQAQKHSKLRKLLIILFSLFLLLTLVGSIRTLTTNEVRSASPFSDELKNQFSYPLYYPSRLPEGYKIESRSIYASTDTNKSLMNITNTEGGDVVIAQQSQLPGLTYDKLSRDYTESRQIPSPFGTLKVGITADNKVVADVLTGETWIVISGESSLFNDASFNDLIQGLVKG
jgi:hypothetical protein